MLLSNSYALSKGLKGKKNADITLRENATGGRFSDTMIRKPLPRDLLSKNPHILVSQIIRAVRGNNPKYLGCNTLPY